MKKILMIVVSAIFLFLIFIMISVKKDNSNIMLNFKDNNNKSYTINNGTTISWFPEQKYYEVKKGDSILFDVDMDQEATIEMGYIDDNGRMECSELMTGQYETTLSVIVKKDAKIQPYVYNYSPDRIKVKLGKFVITNHGVDE